MEVGYGSWSFHGSSPKLPGTLFPQGRRKLSWEYSRRPVKVATSSVETSMEDASTQVVKNVHGSCGSFHGSFTASTEPSAALVEASTRFHGSGRSFRGSGESFRGSSGSFHGSFHEVPLQKPTMQKAVHASFAHVKPASQCTVGQRTNCISIGALWCVGVPWAAVLWGIGRCDALEFHPVRYGGEVHCGAVRINTLRCGEDQFSALRCDPGRCGVAACD